MTMEVGENGREHHKLIGSRRKGRENEMIKGDLEGVNCGIKKKIGLDASYFLTQDDITNVANVAGPTTWALGEQ